MAQERVGEVEAVLGGFPAPMRDVLVPLLYYKSHFLGDWFRAMVRQEQDPELRNALLKVTQDSLMETVETLAAATAWERTRPDAEQLDALARMLHRRVVEEMLAIKESNAESGLLLAMAAPTPELREKLRGLANIDRRHADALRGLLGASTTERLGTVRGGANAAGVHAGRAPGRTLGATLAAAMKEFEARGTQVRRVVMSATALRHLRDEGEVAPDGTVRGTPVDIDFAWAGEAFAIVTGERVSLAEILMREP